MDAGCGDQRDDNEQDDQGDEHDALLVWVDNTKDNNVAGVLTTRFIVVSSAATEQLAAMGLGGRPRDSYPDSGIRIRSGGRSLTKGGEGAEHLNTQHFPPSTMLSGYSENPNLPTPLTKSESGL